MAVRVPNDAIAWKCGRCHTWNDIKYGTCNNCNALIDAVSAFQLESKLTALEEDYYRQTAPLILEELRAIRALLERRLK